MRVVMLALLVLVGGSLLARDLPGASIPTMEERLRVARDYIQAKDWTNALPQLDDAVREEPGNADVHNLLGYVYRKQNKPDLPKAFEHYNMALRLDPSHRGAHEYIGEAYLIAGKPGEAEKHLAQLEKICGNRLCEEYADLAQAIAAYKSRNR